MRNLFKINTLLATIACTCVAGSVLAGEANTCSTNSKSTDICPVAIDNTKATTVKSPAKNHSSTLYTQVSQPQEKEESTRITSLQSSSRFDTNQLILMFLGITIVTAFLQGNNYKTGDTSIDSDLNNQNNSRLYNKLITLVHSPATAKRLFLNTQRKYPERSANWLLEKTIYDLKRDRRAY